MSNIVRFSARNGFARQRQMIWAEQKRDGGARFIAAIICIVVVACIAGFLKGGELELLGAFRSAPSDNSNNSGDTLRASFSFCSGAVRTNCVVDGDTFWFRGEKIRISDIDAPELSPPRCPREAQLGEAAKQRLLALLNGGNFSLVAGWRDEDRYQRKLRTVYRDGHSFGDILVAEGFARHWEGSRRSWCG